MNYETYEVKVCENGDKFWYQNDKLHRLDGPAMEWSDGSKDYWIEDEKYSYEDWKKKVEEINNPIKEMTVTELSKLLGYNVKIVKE